MHPWRPIIAIDSSSTDNTHYDAEFPPLPTPSAPPPGLMRRPRSYPSDSRPVDASGSAAEGRRIALTASSSTGPTDSGTSSAGVLTTESHGTNAVRSMPNDSGEIAGTTGNISNRSTDENVSGSLVGAGTTTVNTTPNPEDAVDGSVRTTMAAEGDLLDHPTATASQNRAAQRTNVDLGTSDMIQHATASGGGTSADLIVRNTTATRAQVETVMPGVLSQGGQLSTAVSMWNATQGSGRSVVLPTAASATLPVSTTSLSGNNGPAADQVNGGGDAANGGGHNVSGGGHTVNGGGITVNGGGITVNGGQPAVNGLNGTHLAAAYSPQPICDTQLPARSRLYRCDLQDCIFWRVQSSASELSPGSSPCTLFQSAVS